MRGGDGRGQSGWEMLADTGWGGQAHIKAALIGASVSVPIKDGKLAMGTWQGIWYLEFRAARHERKVVATIQGEKI